MATLLDSSDLTSRLTAAPRPWWRVEIADVVDSTNTVAAQLATADGAPWTLVAADQQSGGRGRQGRAWASPSGTSISMSMVVPLGVPRSSAAGRRGSGGHDGGVAQRVGWLPLLTGLAVSRALGRLSGRPQAFAVKWPNDVLARPLADSLADSLEAPGEEAAAAPDRKVCGILCQSLWGAGEPLAVVGIGVNVCVPAAELPVEHATSLADCCAGPAPSREDVIVAIADEFTYWHTKFADGGAELATVRDAYGVACATLGAQVRVHLPGDRSLVGRAERVDAQGRLVVREGEERAAGADRGDGGLGGLGGLGGMSAGGGGAVHALAAGDVVHIRPGD